MLDCQNHEKQLRGSGLIFGSGQQILRPQHRGKAELLLCIINFQSKQSKIGPSLIFKLSGQSILLSERKNPQKFPSRLFPQENLTNDSIKILGFLPFANSLNNAVYKYRSLYNTRKLTGFAGLCSPFG